MPHYQSLLKLVMLRLSPQADYLLREHIRRKGDISRLLMEAIYSVNMDNVHPERRWLRCGRYQQKPCEKYAYTSFYLPVSLHKELAKWAKFKKSSISALMDAIIIDFYPEDLGALTTKTEKYPV